VADQPSTVKRIGGIGPVVNDLEWDVKMYLALNGAVHNAAVACWGVKRKYDSVRPISQIRSQPALERRQGAGTWAQAMRRHLSARRPPRTTNGTNAKCTRTTVSARTRYITSG